MKLVIGGAYQGKLAYAKETYHVQDGWIDGRTCRMEAILECSGIYEFHEYVKRMLSDGTCDTDADINRPDAGSELDTGKTDAENADTVSAQFQIQTGHLVSLESQADAFVQMLKEKNPKLIVVSNELGYGVVPMEKKDRMWRETVGRICTGLAKESEEVIRVVCGLGMKLK